MVIGHCVFVFVGVWLLIIVSSFFDLGGCVLFDACGLLLFVVCWLFVVCCLFRYLCLVVSLVLVVGRWLLVAVRCVMFVVRCMLSVFFLLFARCCRIVCCLLFLLFVV